MFVLKMGNDDEKVIKAFFREKRTLILIFSFIIFILLYLFSAFINNEIKNLEGAIINKMG